MYAYIRQIFSKMLNLIAALILYYLSDLYLEIEFQIQYRIDDFNLEEFFIKNQNMDMLFNDFSKILIDFW